MERTAFNNDEQPNVQLTEHHTEPLHNSNTANELDFYFPFPLTPRERQTLEAASYGLTADQTATQLGITSRVVSRFRTRAMVKLGADNITQAVNNGFDFGILSLEESSETNTVQLNPIEVNELRLAARGLTHIKVAEKQKVAPVTVRQHRSKLLRKLQAVNMPHAIRKAREAGLAMNIDTKDLLDDISN
jgi:DNA-binding CsgD family transcriptional regulator